MTNFLPENEQSLYDSMVHGLRERGWSKSDAEAEAIARIDAKRHHPGAITTEDLADDQS